jgi:hypothetical protein
MQKTEVVCDACGRDLTTTSNCEDWRIALINQSIPPMPGIVTSMMIYPKLESDFHFCCWKCLKKWFEDESKYERV